MMDKTYNPQTIESSTYQRWENADSFKPRGQGKSFSIVIPPPNVTGTLHMGHGFQYTLMDTLIRYHRMQGDNTLWQPGCDHAGIATQMVVERQLAQEGKSRHDLGREKFLEKVWQWKEQSGGTINRQIRRLGASPDWSRDRFTMDDDLSQAVRDVFISLYDEGIIYRGERLVNWDPVLLTAISDLEVISEEEKGQLWYFRYPLTNSNTYLCVATTRPETILGDMAVAVNPHDERYQHLIGKVISLPLTDREIPIIADEYVDPEFGSGCVKITPAHDFNDYEIGKRHQLPLLNIMTPTAHINTNAPRKYQGLDRFKARKQIVADMESLGLLEKIEDYTTKIPRGDRSGVVIEPYLTKQWYVKVEALAKPAIDAVRSGAVEFVPENWSKTYFQWMENLQDWCISRQLWWGHRVPAWYDAKGNAYVGVDESDIRKKYSLNSSIILNQDTDVLDTWFSAALWPFTTLGWPTDKKTFETFYPTSVLVTGFDIIFFWVARMIMMGLKFTSKVPFHKVYITGLIRDAQGQKMSKSKGNTLDPIDLIDGIDLESLVRKRCFGLMQPEMAKRIEKDTRQEFPEGIPSHGTDALRFTFCALANNNRNIRFDLNRLTGYRNFCNKLWNAARFVLMNISHDDLTDLSSAKYSIADQWIQSRLQATIFHVHRYFEEYRFDYLAQALYEFIWHEYCDWYLELTKVYLTHDNVDSAYKIGTKHTLISVLDSILRLAHPIIPFITETIWQEVKPLLKLSGDSLMLQSYPHVNEKRIDLQAEAAIVWLQAVTLAVRNIRGEMNIAPSKSLPLFFAKGTPEDIEHYSLVTDVLTNIAKLETATWLRVDELPPASATAIVNGLEIHIPLAGLINVEEERMRLQKEFIKLNKEILRLESKLTNANFVEKAPTEIVAAEREKLAELKATYEKLKIQESKFMSV